MYFSLLALILCVHASRPQQLAHTKGARRIRLARLFHHSKLPRISCKVFVLFRFVFCCFLFHSYSNEGRWEYSKKYFWLQIVIAIAMRWVTTHTHTCHVRKFLSKMHNSFETATKAKHKTIWEGTEKVNFAIVKLNLSMLIKIDWLFSAQIDWKSVFNIQSVGQPLVARNRKFPMENDWLSCDLNTWAEKIIVFNRIIRLFPVHFVLSPFISKQRWIQKKKRRKSEEITTPKISVYHN